jgi:hypothetical protein
MNEKLVTKKFPVSLGKDGEPTRRSEFLVPAFGKPENDVFIGLGSGRERKKGAIAYIGMEVDTDEVLSKIKNQPDDPEKARWAIAEYLRQLRNFKIGNVVSISYHEDGSFVLKKEVERSVSKTPKRKLP